ncbi:hypothetical protein QOT17_012404 [Balamuthia mandrillaris]
MAGGLHVRLSTAAGLLASLLILSFLCSVCTAADDKPNCRRFRSCVLCAAQDHCGWCHFTKECMAGNSSQPFPHPAPLHHPHSSSSSLLPLQPVEEPLCPEGYWDWRVKDCPGGSESWDPWTIALLSISGFLLCLLPLLLLFFLVLCLTNVAWRGNDGRRMGYRRYSFMRTNPSSYSSIPTSAYSSFGEDGGGNRREEREPYYYFSTNNYQPQYPQQQQTQQQQHEEEAGEINRREGGTGGPPYAPPPPPQPPFYQTF